MKKILLCICLLNMTHSATAQNLAKDPSFEDYIFCPMSATPYGGSLSMMHWFNPTRASPDYFNACSNSLGGSMGVPSNVFGYQPASDSNAYMGILVCSSSPANDYKEYVACKLDVPLVTEKYYKVSLDVSLAGRYGNSACDGIGVHFFTNSLPSSYATSWDKSLPFTPKIDYSPYGIIYDSTNWVTLVDTFWADSAYKYVAIGGVVKHINQNIDRYEDTSNHVAYDVAYYFIDNFKIEAVTLTSVSQNKLPEITVSPNPFKDKAVLRLSENIGSPFSISVLNMLGQIVWQRYNIREQEVTIERETLSSGVYYYQLSTKGQLIHNGKLIIE